MAGIDATIRRAGGRPVTVIDKPRSLPEVAPLDARINRAIPHLLSVATAVPELCRDQLDVQHAMAESWGLHGAGLQRWRRIIAGSGIRTRHGVMPLEGVIHLSTSQRMQAYERFAPELAEEAARSAMSRANVGAAEITDLIVVSCTGFSAPGVDVALVERLELDRTVRRTIVGFMGCFGAISGLRTAVGACAANPGAIALVVCVELCSLHMRADANPQNQVASALFADGAAAAIVTSAPLRERGREGNAAAIGRVTTGHSALVADTRELMTWRITDAGFAMTLEREVPAVLGAHLNEFVAGACASRPELFVLHPGGPGILDAADEALGLRGECGIESSRAVLSRFGNMSSPTVLFVLDEALRHGYRAPALMLAFGPGLTIESLSVLASIEPMP